jgi:hypothetical protein
LDFDSGAISTIVEENGPGMYPGVSPDETTVYFSREMRGQTELWLVENFR